MSQAGFAVVAFMIGAYVLLDGFDLGAGAVSFFVGRTPAQRAAVMESIGPYWNGNEVWLIAAGGALFALFPKAYASAFSGFYLPFIISLWLLMFRGIAMELRGHFAGELWHQFWDVAFALSSALLLFVFGLALGNLLRGIPLDARGYFQGTFALLLNPYALLVAVFAVCALAQHAAVFLTLRIEGAPATRAVALQGVLWWVVLALYLALTGITFALRGAPGAFWAYALPAVSLAALAVLPYLMRRAAYGAAFGVSSLFIASLMTGAAATLFPYLLPGYPAGSGGVTIYDASPPAASLEVALTATIAGTIAVLIYGSYVARTMSGKVHVE